MAAANSSGEKKEVILDKKLLVAAIDFGTTYSGYAYMTYNDFIDKSQPNKDKTVHAPTWNDGKLMSHKTATALLLKPDKSFDCFGFDAENKYLTLAQADEDDEDDKDVLEYGTFDKWFFFHRFKMLLHENQKLQRNTLLYDETKKPLEAMVVFAHCIRYLKNEMWKKVSSTFTGVKDTDIRYVLTVPAIWDDDAKQFMEEAAVKAGIPLPQLCIALEPEAAAILCKELNIERTEEDGHVQFTKSRPGTKFMVADLGGGTADITVFESKPDHSLEEISPASGGPWGGINVDKEFRLFLESILTKKVMEEFQKSATGDYMELFKEFELRKREFASTKSNIFVSVPLALVSTVAKKSNVKDIKMLVEKSKYSSELKFNEKNNKFKFPPTLFGKLFHDTVEGILDHIDNIIKKEVKGHIDKIIVVGGFADCEILQTAIKGKFQDKQVVIPPEAGLAVLKGAVIYGHMPEAVSARTARYTYGIQSWPEFSPGVHPPSKKVMMDGVYRCKDVFFTFIKKGQKVKPNFRKSQVFEALKPEEKTLECTVYVSREEYPKFITDESCKPLGVLEVPLPEHRPGKPLQIEETLIFGGTVLHVEAREVGSNKTFKATFNTLGLFHGH